MALPTSADVHVDGLLTSISIAYMQSPQAFVADRVFPNLPVAKKSDKYARYDRSDFWRNQFARRAPSSESAGGGWKVDTSATYYADRWALHKDVDDEIRANADDPFDMDRDATLWLSQQAMISREVNWASAYFTTSKWTTDITGVAATAGTDQVLQWNDASSAPIENVKDYATTSHQLTGYRPNKLVVGRQVWDKLSEHADIVDRIKYSGGVSPSNPAIVSRQAAAALMEIDEVLVADGIQATSDENKDFETSMTTAFIAGKQALLVYANPTPSLMMPSGGYTFSWTGVSGAGQMGQRITTLRLPAITSDRVEMEMFYDQKLVCADCGVFFASIVA